MMWKTSEICLGLLLCNVLPCRSLGHWHTWSNCNHLGHKERGSNMRDCDLQTLTLARDVAASKGNISGKDNKPPLWLFILILIQDDNFFFLNFDSSKVCGCYLVHFFYKKIIFSNFYWLDLHTKTLVGLVNLQWNMCIKLDCKAHFPWFSDDYQKCMFVDFLIGYTKSSQLCSQSSVE